jgi:hypothetical protein
MQKFVLHYLKGDIDTSVVCILIGVNILSNPKPEILIQYEEKISQTQNYLDTFVQQLQIGQDGGNRKFEMHTHKRSTH